MSLLSVIVPIRSLPDRNITERLLYCVGDPLLDRNKIDFIVVDDGSPIEDRKCHEAVCEKAGLRYHYIDTQNKSVNMARARNAGVWLAQTKYIMFMDVDLYPYPGYYNDILKEIKLQRLDEHPDDLIMTGVIYLSKNFGVEQFFNTEPKKRKDLFLHYASEDESEFIEKISTGTSVTLMHRERYLELGGYDESFEQWGYEDLEFNLRAMYHSDRFPLPKDFTKEIKSFADIDVYRGWKSMYRLYGDITFKKEIVLFHIWHKVDRSSEYALGYEKNRQRFVKKITTMAKEQRAGVCRVSKRDPVFDQFHNTDSPLSLRDYYKNSPLIAWVQPLKSIPLVGSFLLALKKTLLGKER
jgi:predicted glycosyltransferase involved in capsule biosynthesis